MRILVTKDSSTKIPREVADLAEARCIAALGFHVELMQDDGSLAPIPAEEVQPQEEAARATDSVSVPADAPATDVAKKSTAPAKKQAPATKAPPAKKAAAKRR